MQELVLFQARQGMAKQHGIVGQYGESHREMTELPLAQSQLREFLSTQLGANDRPQRSSRVPAG